MKARIMVILGVVALLVAVFAVGTGFAGGDDDGTEVPITGQELERATDAALAHLGEGTVTETEKGDEESLYEVEVTLEDGTEVDVQLDENFAVVGTEEDGPEDADNDD